MFDAKLLPLLKPLIAKPASMLNQKGVSADQVTVLGFVIGAGAVVMAAFGFWSAALVLVLVNRFCDGLDGELARISTPTDRGAFLDIALDFAFYAAFPLGFALNAPDQNALPAAVLIASFVGTGSSFLAFSLIADRKGLQSDQYPTKGIYYLGGLTEGTETIALFVAMCLFPQLFPVLAYGFAALCLLTTVLRWLAGWRLL